MSEIVDQRERDLAINPFQSFIVTAPAGAGKTGLITQSMRKLLRIVNYHDEEIDMKCTRKEADEEAGRGERSVTNERKKRRA